MKPICILLVAILASCSLFKKTTKTSIQEVKEFRKLTEAAAFNEKSTGKYSELFTFRKDGSVYQYQYLKDTSNEVKLAVVKIAQAQTDSHEETVKSTVPYKLWIYVGVLIVLGIGVFVYWKLNR